MAFSRPVIGINVDLVAASKTGGAFVRLAAGYFDKIYEAGGLPIMPPQDVIAGREQWHREMGPFNDEFGAAASPMNWRPVAANTPGAASSAAQIRIGYS